MCVTKLLPNTSLLADLVCVRQNGLRSVNVERDLHSLTAIEGYVLTAQARACLARILDGLVDSTRTRSWTLTGPYGSGKSYFGLFLLNLLSKDQPAHSHALNLMKQADPLLAQQVLEAAHTNTTRGFLPIPVTGYRAPLQESLKHGLKHALQGVAEKPDIRAALADVEQWSAKTESRPIVRTLQTLIKDVIELGYCGILLIFDELGKPLEYSAAYIEQADVYLLQELAELANRSGETPFVFACILHQAFERYSALLDSTTQREWAKVQGRFEDIAFQEPPNQQMWLLVNALETDSGLLEMIRPSLRYDAEQAAASGWCPPMMREDEFVGLGERAYPLHPTVMAALPYLFRRLAQNERSIFAYLASHEPFGFQEFIRQNHHPALIRLPDLFDYLSANFQARLYSSGRTRAITETLERLSNANGLSILETDLLKTIGLLSWLGEVSPLHAKRANLLSALQSPRVSDHEIQDALHTLQARSQIVYRRFNQTYAVWQGSDVDIEERLEEASRKVGSAFSLAEAVQHYLPPHPLVARRHSYQTGTLRYFEVQYVDTTTCTQVSLTPSSAATGLILLCLPANFADVDTFTQWAQQPPLKRADIVVGIASRTTRLAELLHELRCLHWVADHTPELVGDQVARRELRARLAAVETLIRNELENAISLYRLGDASRGQWFHAGRAIRPQARLGLTHLLSNICDDLYPEAPRLWNELINRRVLSSQGAAARRSLLEGILQRAEKENLGIEAYPPERSMYESLLKASGLHQQGDPDHWILADPPETDPLHLRPAWDAMADFIFHPPAEPRPVPDLFNYLRQPPYGLTDGVLPVFLCAFLLVHQHETTLYREGSLRPELEIADWEVLLRRPELFAVAGCRIEGKRVAILERFGRGLDVQAAAMPVVRALIRNLKALPEHAWRTQRLPDDVLVVRRTIETARSPERLLFHDLPEALGLRSFDERDADDAQVELYFERLNAALQALVNAMPRLRNQARDQFLTACALPAGENGWQMFLSLAGELLPRAINPNLLPLLRRAAETPDTRAALESVLTLIASRPLRTWTDLDADRFAEQAQYFGELIRIERNGNTAMLDLPPEKRQRSQEVAVDLQRYLEELEDDPQILEVALRLLTQKIHSQKKLP